MNPRRERATRFGKHVPRPCGVQDGSGNAVCAVCGRPLAYMPQFGTYRHRRGRVVRVWR